MRMTAYDDLTSQTHRGTRYARAAGLQITWESYVRDVRRAVRGYGSTVGMNVQGVRPPRIMHPVRRTCGEGDASCMGASVARARARVTTGARARPRSVATDNIALHVDLGYLCRDRAAGQAFRICKVCLSAVSHES
eukprot:COSAG02_NODE_4959_length_4781_cov_2.142674_4_plen_136_part_00